MVPPQPTPESGALGPSAGPPTGLAAVALGQTWSLDASCLDPTKLEGAAGLRALQALFADLIRVLDLHPVGEPLWHVFSGGDYHGVTGVVALSESHLACHTFPEHGAMTLDLYTCRARTAPSWADIIERHVGSGDEVPVVELRVHERGLAPRISAGERSR